MQNNTLPNNRRTTMIWRMLNPIVAIWAAFVPTTLKDLVWKDEQPVATVCSMKKCQEVPVSMEHTAIIADDYSSTY